MSRKKFSKEFKLKLLKEHDENGISYWKLGKEYGIEASIIRRWGYAYATFGEAGLEKHNSDQCNYSAEFKQMVVTEYKKLQRTENIYTLSARCNFCLFIFLFWQVISPFVFYNDSVNRKEMNFHEKQIPQLY